MSDPRSLSTDFGSQYTSDASYQSSVATYHTSTSPIPSTTSTSSSQFLIHRLRSFLPAQPTASIPNNHISTNCQPLSPQIGINADSSSTNASTSYMSNSSHSYLSLIPSTITALHRQNVELFNNLSSPDRRHLLTTYPDRFELESVDSSTCQLPQSITIPSIDGHWSLPPTSDSSLLAINSNFSAALSDTSNNESASIHTPSIVRDLDNPFQEYHHNDTDSSGSDQGISIDTGRTPMTCPSTYCDSAQHSRLHSPPTTHIVFPLLATHRTRGCTYSTYPEDDMWSVSSISSSSSESTCTT